MAVKFLNNLDLVGNQIKNVILDVQSGSPSSLGEGQIFYNSASTEKTIKFANSNASFKAVLNVEEAGLATGGIPMGSINKYKLEESPISFNKSNNYIVFSANAGLFLDGGNLFDSKGNTGSAGEVFSSLGTGNGNQWVTAPGYSKWVLSDGTNTQDVSDGDTVIVGGGTNITTVVSATDTVRIDLDDSIILAGELTVQGAGQSSFAGQVTIPATPTTGTDAASKAYVDDVTAGGLIYQGGYNANTNIPNLETPNPNSILKGWTYTVTVEGLFFTEQVRVGDLLIAEQDAPTTLQNWTTVQNNIDLATTLQVGIGNVIQPLAGETNLKGINVTYNKPGTATVGLDFDELVDKGAKPTTSDFVILNSQDPETRKDNYKLSLTDLAQYVGGGESFAGSSTSGTTHVFTHNLGSLDVIVQIFDNVTSETVYATVDRTSTSVVTVTTSKSANIRCLIQKVG
tara:strand:+ start:979 stop:2346 length:1368 start_codon:yes stop_codon:yes gene_type:complete